MKLYDTKIVHGMNEKLQTLEVIHSITKLAKDNKAIFIHVNDFTELLRSEEGDLPMMIEPETEREVLRTGHYANYDGMKIFVDKTIEPGTYEIFDPRTLNK